MDNTTLQLLTTLMAAMHAEQEATQDASNSKFIGIMMNGTTYVGYIYFNEPSEAEAIIQKPENEGMKLHTFKYKRTLSQKPREVIEVSR